MPDIDLDAIKARIAAIPGGPDYWLDMIADDHPVGVDTDALEECEDDDPDSWVAGSIDLIRHAPADLAALLAENRRLRAVADAVRKYLSADAAMQSDPSALSIRITAFDRWQSARTAAYAALDALDVGGEGS